MLQHLRTVGCVRVLHQPDRRSFVFLIFFFFLSLSSPAHRVIRLMDFFLLFFHSSFNLLSNLFPIYFFHSIYSILFELSFTQIQTEGMKWSSLCSTILLVAVTILSFVSLHRSTNSIFLSVCLNERMSQTSWSTQFLSSLSKLICSALVCSISFLHKHWRSCRISQINADLSTTLDAPAGPLIASFKIRTVYRARTFSFSFLSYNRRPFYRGAYVIVWQWSLDVREWLDSRCRRKSIRASAGTESFSVNQSLFRRRRLDSWRTAGTERDRTSSIDVIFVYHTHWRPKSCHLIKRLSIHFSPMCHSVRESLSNQKNLAILVFLSCTIFPWCFFFSLICKSLRIFN